MKIIKYLILGLLYFFCCFAAFKGFQNAYYNPKGRWTNISPDFGTYFFTFAPGFNIMPTIDFFILNGWEEEKYRRDDNIFKPPIKQ